MPVVSPEGMAAQLGWSVSSTRQARKLDVQELAAAKCLQEMGTLTTAPLSPSSASASLPSSARGVRQHRLGRILLGAAQVFVHEQPAALQGVQHWSRAYAPALAPRLDEPSWARGVCRNRLGKILHGAAQVSLNDQPTALRAVRHRPWSYAAASALRFDEREHSMPARLVEDHCLLVCRVLHLRAHSPLCLPFSPKKHALRLLSRDREFQTLRSLPLSSLWTGSTSSPQAPPTPCRRPASQSGKDACACHACNPPVTPATILAATSGSAQW